MAARRLPRKLPKKQGWAPRVMISDTLRSATDIRTARTRTFTHRAEVTGAAMVA